jgi:hypothetical protein
MQTTDILTAPQLQQTLLAFQKKANEHPRIESLIRDWSPVIIVESTDTDARYFMPVSAGKIVECTASEHASNHTVHLRATESQLTAIFCGESNPAESFLNGELEIYATDKDQVKLDAISLVLWGI